MVMTSKLQKPLKTGALRKDQPKPAARPTPISKGAKA